MSLCLTITSYHKITPGQLPEKSMDKGVMAIGRSLENDWVLPDPERLVSAKHCVIQYKNGRYYLTDHSTNGVELVKAGVRLRRGNSEWLEDGEVIRIGDYEIGARIDADSMLADSTPFGLEVSSTFEALMGRQNTPAPLSKDVHAMAHFKGGAAQDTFPDLFDFLTPASVPPATQSDHVPVEHHDFRPPIPQASAAPVMTPTPSVIPEDWDLLSDVAAQPLPLAAAPVVPVGPVDVAPVFTVEPDPVQMHAIERVEPSVPAAIAGGADLLHVFLRGAGLDQLRIDPAQAQSQMELIGRSYRLMVEGLIDVLRARSSLKGEFRMHQTMISPVENNPLKFAPNADEALLLLLRRGNDAFMSPDLAIADSFDDLRAHQLAVMAGVEAAINALLKRFEPSQLEARMGKPGALSNLFGSRHAQNWQQFTELYAQISREAEEDFQELFGREFSRAYEEHSTRQRRS